MGEDIIVDGRDAHDKQDLTEGLVVAMRSTSAADPELLASFIYRNAGPDLEANHQGLERDIIKLRGRILDAMNAIQTSARRILDTPVVRQELNEVEQTIAELLGELEANYSHVEKARQYLALLAEIADFPVPLNLNAFREKPELDVTTSRVVLAVKEYCSIKDIPFTGGPRSMQADKKAMHIAKAEAAKLVKEVLDALHLDHKPAQIATYMNKARSAFSI